MTRARVVAVALAGVVASNAAAQGTLSTQGFGYPAGGFSTRALTMGGAVGELDAVSTLNPAALTSWGRSGLYGQFGPEFRSVESGAGTDKSTVIRFPLFTGAINATEQLVFGLSFSNFLDRTWATRTSGYYHVSPTDSVGYTQNFQSGGAITNVRFAAGYRLSNTLRVGLGGHFFTGQSTLTITELFADSGFASFLQITTVNVTGTGLSAGLAWSPRAQFALGLSGQLGGVMHARRNDSLVSNARVPARAGGTLLFAGVPGVVLAADAEWTQWSAMNGLAQSTLLAVDAWDYGVGAEVRLPGVGSADIPLRLGWRRRTLPFQADSQTVRETVISGGFGIPVATNRGRIDFGILHASRTAPVTPAAKESAWTISIGILVRP